MAGWKRLLQNAVGYVSSVLVREIQGRSSVRRLLTSRLLPVSAVILGLIVLLCGYQVTRILEEEIQSRIIQSAGATRERVAERLKSTLDTIELTASNHVVTNSIADFESREQVLKPFLLSLRIPGPEQQTAAVLDYQNRGIFVRGSTNAFIEPPEVEGIKRNEHLELEMNAEARTVAQAATTARESGKAAVVINEAWAVFAAPVSANGSFSASVVVIFSADDYLKGLRITHADSPCAVAVSGRVIWASNEDLWKRGENGWEKTPAADDDWFCMQQPMQGVAEGTLLLAESRPRALSSVSMVWGKLSWTIFGGVAVLSIAVWVAAGQVVSPVDGLIRRITQIRTSGVGGEGLEPTGPGELRRLAMEFNSLMAELSETTVSREELRAAELRLSLALESANIVVWDWNLNTDQVYFSPQLRQQLGYTSWSQLSDWSSCLHPDDLSRTTTLVDKYLRGESTSYLAEFRLKHADGNYRWIRGIGRLIREHDGSGDRFVGVNIDITAEREAEEIQRRLSEELATASHAAGMAQAATGVLHNVGNALNSVNVASQMLRGLVRGPGRERLAKVAEIVSEHAGNLTAFVQTDPRAAHLPGVLASISETLKSESDEAAEQLNSMITSISHIKEIIRDQQSAASYRTVRTKVSLQEFVEQCLVMAGLKEMGGDFRLVCEFNYPGEVELDRNRVMQILVNIMKNARESVESAGGERGGGVVTLRTERRSDTGQIAISVMDDGQGMDSETLSSVFVHGYTTKERGHGFGLHHSANLAREMGGRLTAYSDGLGRGAEFCLTLPEHTASGAPTALTNAIGDSGRKSVRSVL